MWMWWILGASAAPLPGDPALARLSAPVRQALALAEAGDVEALRDRPWAHDEGLSVVLEPSPDADLFALRRAAEAAGCEVEATGVQAVQVHIPWHNLAALPDLPGLGRARLPWRASPKSTQTEGYDAVMLQDWHEEGIDGEGVTIGVIDVSFDGWEDLDDDEFPADASANLSYEGDDEDGHGAEVTEILYDFAPGASYLLGAFQSDVQLCEVLLAMVDNDVDVVNASVGFDNLWSTDASSGLTQCVDLAAEEGVAVFVSAGNEAERYRTGALDYADAGGTIAIDGETRIWIPSEDGDVDVRLRWSETFGAATQDIDLTVYNADGSVCGSSDDPQDGAGDPFEQVEENDCKGRVYAELSSEGQAADLSGLTAWLYSATGLEEGMAQGEGSISLPGDAALGITVGAWSLSAQDIAPYSSWGPTEDGRTKPDLVAPTEVSTETRGRAAFEGTSAAAPHAAGVAALWVAASGGNRELDAMRAWLADGARDVGEEGRDNRSGDGLVQADELPDWIVKGRCGCAAGPAQGWLAGLVGALLAARRRRR